MTERPDDAGQAPPLCLGYVAGVHGVRGGLRMHLHDAGSDAVAPGRRVVLRRDEGQATEYEVESVGAVPGKPHRRRVTLVGIVGRDAADALRGSTVFIDRQQLPALADDEFYLVDTIGLPVEREHAGVVQGLGEVVGLASNGAQDLLEVKWQPPAGPGQQWLLPVLPHTIVEIDAQRVLVDLPRGMLPEALETEP